MSRGAVHKTTAEPGQSNIDNGSQQVPPATAAPGCVPQPTLVFLPSACDEVPGTPEWIMGASVLALWLVPGLQLPADAL